MKKVKEFLKKDKLKLILIMLPSIAIAIVFSYLPFVKTIEKSFTLDNDIYDYSKTEIGTNNFVFLFKDPVFITSIGNTSFLLFVIAPFSLILFFLLSVAINNISNRICKKSFISLLFSQFFISSYAIGISFMVLFSKDNNVLNSIFKTNTPFSSQNSKAGVLLSLSIFYIWRISAISMILFVFSFNKINRKLFLIGKIDSFSFWHKIKIIYLPNIKNTFYLIIYINIFESLFLYPTIFKNTIIVNGQTIMYYIVHKFSSSNNIQWSIASAASLLLFLYSLLIILIIILSKNVYKIINRRKCD